MLDKFFALSKNKTTVRIELLAGLTTFLTMAYIIFVQPLILTHTLDGKPTGMDFGAVTTATCLTAALATLIMGLYAKYPIAQAPGMGENIVFVSLVAALINGGSATPWQTALGVVFVAGVLFMALSLLGVREKMIEMISPSMRNGMAIGIGLFIAFIGLKNGGLVIGVPNNLVGLDPKLGSPDVIIFLLGLLVTAGLHARGVRGSIVWGILAGLILSVTARLVLPHMGEAISSSTIVTESRLMREFAMAEAVVAAPPSLAPTFLAMDIRGALTVAMIPYILIFLFMDLFDTLGTLLGVSEQAGLIENDKLPRAKQALVSDAVGTVAGAALGTSTVTSFIESAAGVEQGGRTGLTAVTAAGLFLVALFFSPLIDMVGSYPPITAPALVVVGSMMMRNVTKIDWSNYAESAPAFLIIIGIPLTFSISDGLALGFVAYPIVKLISGQGRDVKWMMYVLAVLLAAYFLLVRPISG